MVTALAAVLLGFQNPNPPHVDLPAGWKVDYNRMNVTREGYLLGPKGEEIKFPAYGGTGDLAAELRGSDPKSIFTYAVLDGRQVSVAIAADGRLVVSYPQAWPNTHSSFAPFDYSTKVRTAREAADDLLILLTRIEAYKNKYGGGVTSAPPEPKTMFFLDYWMGSPWGWMSKPLTYTYQPDAPAARFVSVGKPTVEAFLPEPTAKPRTYKWEETRTLLGREFHIAEGEKGGLSAWVLPPPGAPAIGVGPIFTTEEATPQAAVVLVLMRLSFAKLER